MIVDPWGAVVAQCSNVQLHTRVAVDCTVCKVWLVHISFAACLCVQTSPDLAVAEVDLDYLDKVRTSMPVLSHQKPGVYKASCAMQTVAQAPTEAADGAGGGAGAAAK